MSTHWIAVSFPELTALISMMIMHLGMLRKYSVLTSLYFLKLGNVRYHISMNLHTKEIQVNCILTERNKITHILSILDVPFI